jgi:Galactose-3-O-sulfotransferase
VNSGESRVRYSKAHRQQHGAWRWTRTLVSNHHFHWRKLGSTLLLITFGIFSFIILPYRQRQWFLLNSLHDYQKHQPDPQPIANSPENDTAVDEDRGINTNRANELGTFVSQIEQSSPKDVVKVVPDSNGPFPVRNNRDTITPNDNFMGIVARPFSSWPIDAPLPCYRAHDQWMDMSVQFSPARKGLFYLKPYKTGSSTTSGVHLRMARNIAQRRTGASSFDICDIRFDHGPDPTPGYTLFRDRLPEQSFLWTVLRDPTQRAVSHFFHFMVSRKKLEPTDRNFKSFLRDKAFPIQDYYFHALYTKEVYNRNLHKPTSVANHILRTYNFIGITERMDESFVALMMLLRLKIADILYISAKTKGGYDDAGNKQPQACTYIWPSFVSPGMKEFFDSKEWREIVRHDRLLYEAVNRSLDLTIDQLGREKFGEQLRIFQEAQKISKERCLPNTTFPCDASGIFHRENTTDCLWKDSGCGTTCLDQIATELNLW